MKSVRMKPIDPWPRGTAGTPALHADNQLRQFLSVVSVVQVIGQHVVDHAYRTALADWWWRPPADNS